MLHNYRSGQFHRTSNGINLSSGFREMGSAKSGPSAAWFDKLLTNGQAHMGQMTITLYIYTSIQVHKTLNGVNPSSGFRNMHSAKSGLNFWQIWQVFGRWASPYGAYGKMTIMTVHNYRPRQFHRTSNLENPSHGYRDMGSANLAAARPAARTKPLQPGGLRGKNPWGICVRTQKQSCLLTGTISEAWRLKVIKIRYFKMLRNERNVKSSNFFNHCICLSFQYKNRHVSSQRYEDSLGVKLWI